MTMKNDMQTIRHIKEALQRVIDSPYAEETCNLSKRACEVLARALAEERRRAFRDAAKATCVFCNEFGKPQEQNEVLTNNGEPYWHRDGQIWRKCRAPEIWARREAEGA